ncbi:MAG: ATP-dependent zinc protease [Cycloclasticus sp.]
MYKKSKQFSLAFTLVFVMTGCSFLSVFKPAEVVNEPLICPEAKTIEKVIEKIVRVTVPAKTGGKLDLAIIGEVETVQVEPSKLRYAARIDTGAESSSIHAENIQLVERDGKKSVVFSLRDPATGALVTLERKFRRRVIIKQKVGKPERRYVVKLWLTLGKVKELVEVTLTNRSDFKYKLLIGRNLLIDTAIVDVSRKNTLKPLK